MPATTTTTATATDDEPANKKIKMVDEKAASSTNLQSMKYTNEGGSTPQLKVLDQLLLPHEKVYIDVPDVVMAYTVIKSMQIRGTLFLSMCRMCIVCLLSIVCCILYFSVYV